ncbi:unnamed protein product [Paramecium sonneborni]|uniref:Uncharacterized protein n=1 Tax=Paramecium sonneborni TaxID=65129 RepID=A0A8S1RT19_9CILI|nr:unnamed protein product [Paramecium sonneborni]
MKKEDIFSVVTLSINSFPFINKLWQIKFPVWMPILQKDPKQINQTGKIIGHKKTNLKQINVTHYYILLQDLDL